MVQYTEEFLAAARQGYENTDQPMRELARELGIGVTTLSTLAEKNGWAKRSQRQRGLPPAMQLLAEAQALAASGPHPSRLAEPVIGPAQEGRTRWLAPQDDGVNAAPPSPPLVSLVEGGEQSALAAPDPAELLIKLEQILAQLIAAQQLAPANGIHSPQGARTLTLLIQAMRTLKGMRGPARTDTGSIDNDYDDMPRDLDEFRHALARRIDALFESETDTEDAEENSGCANVDAP